MLGNAVITGKIGPDSFLVVLRSLAVNFSPVGNHTDMFRSLLVAPCVQHLPPAAAYQAVSMLIDLGHQVWDTWIVTNWARELSPQQLLTLMQRASQHGNVADVYIMCGAFPAAEQLSTGCVLQLILQLVHHWRGEGSAQAIRTALGLPGAAMLSAQECGQLAALAIQKGGYSERSMCTG
jgi:hypothetical protein